MDVRAGSRARRRVVLAAMLIVALVVPATAAAAPRSEFYGIVQTATLDNQDVEGMLAARVRTNRFVLKWGWVQPVKGSFRWGPADDFIGGLAARGIRTVPSIWGNPSWVAGSASTPPIGGAVSEQAWRVFLKALVKRYGPGGAYWRTPFHEQFGANAKALPIQSWQIWNEPNLKKFFAPYPSPGKYARLLQISRDTIKGQIPQARIVLAGMPGFGDVKAWDFLRALYAVPRIKNKFDAVALHPYGPTISQVQSEIQNTRNVIKNHGDAAKPLWLTELAWGSAPPDRFGINKGPDGQKTMLNRSFKMILAHRTAWNIQRLFWFHWRDPRNLQAGTCSFCGSSGLLRYDRTPKPAFAAFTSFTAETNPPQVAITAGPKNGAFVKNPRPRFSFTSSEAGSTFECRVDSKPFSECSSPLTTAQLADGVHSFSVRAIDAPGNKSGIASRSFTVDTHPPAIPRITGTTPASPADNNAPRVRGTAGPGTTVKIFKTVGCTGTPHAKGSAVQFNSPGILVLVPDNSTTSFRARATDAAGNTSGCSTPFTYVEDSTGP